MNFLIFYLADFTLSGRNNARKMKFSIKNFFSKCDQICSFQQLVTFTEEILNGKLHFFVQWNELVVFVIWTSHFTFLNSHIISEFLLKVNSLTKLSSSEDSPLPSCRFDLSDFLIFTIFIYLFMLLTIAYQSSIIPKKLANRNYVVHNIWVRTIFKHKGPN